MNTQFIILDLEMNPVDHHLAHGRLSREVIEIGAVRIDSNLHIVDTYTCVVNPSFNRRIEPMIVRLTGITTGEVSTAHNFSYVLADFLNWIGTSPTQIYSWSNSDLLQFQQECESKDLNFPVQFQNWVDFQEVFPNYIGYSQGRCFNLMEAARIIGSDVNIARAHRALYDAQVTANLVLFALRKEYLKFSCHVNQAQMHYSLGEACGGKLADLLKQMQKKEGFCHAKQCDTAAEYCR